MPKPQIRNAKQLKRTLKRLTFPTDRASCFLVFSFFRFIFVQLCFSAVCIHAEVGESVRRNAPGAQRNSSLKLVVEKRVANAPREERAGFEFGTSKFGFPVSSLGVKDYW